MPTRLHHSGAGFTLVELLVALSVMLILSLLSWRGVDGMLRTQMQVREHGDEVQALQIGLAQWGTDLDALASGPRLSALDWDGRVLRITRRSADGFDAGLQVVAWTLRNVQGTGQWLRWQSAPVRTQDQWQTAWQQALLWARSPGVEEIRNEVLITPLAQWQLFYFRNNAWSNPLSSADSASSTPVDTSVPDGIRLVLTLSPGRALSGALTRDWVRPTAGGNKS